MRALGLFPAVVTAFAAGLMLMGPFAGPAIAAQSSGEPPVVILVLDTSRSMSDSDIVTATDAAMNFARSIPGDVRVGAIAFDTDAELVVHPTTSRGDLRDGLAGQTSGGRTSLYDAVSLGVSTLDQLSGSGERRLVVLSDGGDSSSNTTLNATATQLATSGIAADVVAFKYGTKNTAPLRKLAGAAGGRVVPVENASQLSSAFGDIAAEATQRSDGGALSWLPDWAQMSQWSWQLWAVIGMTFVAVLLLVLLIFGPGGPKDTRKRGLDQIARYGNQPEPAAAQQVEETSVGKAAVAWTENILRTRGWEEKLAERLDIAGLKIKPAEWTLLQVCAGIVAAALLILLGAPVLIGVPLGPALAFTVTVLFVRVRTSRRRKAFGEQLPDVLQLVAGSLQSGFSLAQALDGVVREETQPSAGEFSRAIAETRIGVELEDAMERVATRMASEDLRWVVMAIRIQREVGGNLAEVLLTTVKTMRERAQTRRQVRALSAEGRLSAYILVALPIVLGAVFFTIRPEYMRPLYTTLPGVLMLVGGVLFTALGALWMKKLVKVEV
ncbi:MAG: VWA domain-containing protein [Actinophytocola sp.]|nr:VWA domain-containing protein [Actinophytocola sp.]